MNDQLNRPPGKSFPFWKLAFALSFLGSVSLSHAQITLTDNNSVAKVDPTSQAGMFYWAVQGQNQLEQQWFWYGVGAGAVKSIDTISAPNIVVTGTRELTTSYVNPGNFSVSIDYLLTGGTVVAAGQHAEADIGETIKIVNLSATVLPYHFYQYSHFNLDGANNDVVQLGQNGRGLYNDALQQNDSVALSETVTTPGANHGEVAFVGGTLLKLNGGGPVTLGPPDFSGPIGPGAVTWALEWDLNIAPGGSAIISKDKYLDIVVLPIPEPSALALIGLGTVGFSLWKRRRTA